MGRRRSSLAAHARLDFLQGPEPDGHRVHRRRSLPIPIASTSPAAPTPTPKRPMGAILRSSDRGRTFQRTNVPIKFGGNEDGRGNGERLVVDPKDGRILYLGTRHDGLWRSRDRGVTWTRVASFPDVTEAASPASAPIPGETPQQHWRRMPIRGRRHCLRQIRCPLHRANSASPRRPSTSASR